MHDIQIASISWSHFMERWIFCFVIRLISLVVYWLYQRSLGYTNSYNIKVALLLHHPDYLWWRNQSACANWKTAFRLPARLRINLIDLTRKWTLINHLPRNRVHAVSATIYRHSRYRWSSYANVIFMLNDGKAKPNLKNASHSLTCKLTQNESLCRTTERRNKVNSASLFTPCIQNKTN